MAKDLPRTIEELAPEERKFFKYTSRHVAEIVLRDRRLRWTTPGTLNDPFDTQFDLHMPSDLMAVRHLSLKRLWDAHFGPAPAKIGSYLGQLIAMTRGLGEQPTWEEFCEDYGAVVDKGIQNGIRFLPTFHAEVRAQMATNKVICVSETGDSLPMWAYYAESYQGVVLRFRSAPGVDSPWKAAQAVRYEEKMPVLGDEDFFAAMFAGEISLSVEDVVEKIVLTKARDWAHEREWRINAGDGRDANATYEDVPFHPQELDAVLLGCRMPSDDRLRICELVATRYPHAEIIQMSKAEKCFELEANTLTL